MYFSRAVMKVVVALIVLAFCAVGSNATIFTREQSEKLAEVRNQCALQSGLGPYEIGAVVRALRPAEKLVATGQCVLRTLNQIPDPVAADILYQIKVLFEGGVLPNTIKQIIAACEEAVGPAYCQKAVDLVQLILELGRRNGIDL